MIHVIIVSVMHICLRHLWFAVELAGLTFASWIFISIDTSLMQSCPSYGAESSSRCFLDWQNPV